MKAERGYPRYTVTPKAEAAILRGHPWVYGEEVLDIQGETGNGGLVDVVQPERPVPGHRLPHPSSPRSGSASSPATPTTASTRPSGRRKLRWAWDYRKSGAAGRRTSDCCRVIFGEADALPRPHGGPLRPHPGGPGPLRWHGASARSCPPPGPGPESSGSDGQTITGVYERNDVALRDKEGLPQGKGWYPPAGRDAPPASPVTEITENGVTLPGGRGERAEDRLLPGPEVQPPGGRRGSPGGKTGAGLLHPHRLLRPERRSGRREARVTAVDVSQVTISTASAPPTFF